MLVVRVSDREAVDDRFVDAVDLQELVDACVVKAADRNCGKIERGGSEQEVLPGPCSPKEVCVMPYAVWTTVASWASESGRALNARRD